MRIRTLAAHYALHTTAFKRLDKTSIKANSCPWHCTAHHGEPKIEKSSARHSKP